jgi:hypothetical protein
VALVVGHWLLSDRHWRGLVLSALGIANGWQGNLWTTLRVGGWGAILRITAILHLRLNRLTLTFFLCFACVLFLLLSGLPFFADFFELCDTGSVWPNDVACTGGRGSQTFGRSLQTMRLHCDMGVQVIERAVRLLTTLVAALVHALYLLIPSARPFMLLCAWNGNKRVDLVRIRYQIQVCGCHAGRVPDWAVDDLERARTQLGGRRA